MKTTACTRCDAVLESDMRFCEQCGMAVPPPVSATAFVSTTVREEAPRTEPRNQGRGRIGVMTAVVACLAVLGFAGWWLGTHRTAAAVTQEAKAETKAATKSTSTIPPSTIAQAETKVAAPEKEAPATRPIEKPEESAALKTLPKKAFERDAQAPLMAEAKAPRSMAKAEPASDSVVAPQPERPAKEASAIAPVAVQPPANEQAPTAPEEIVTAKPEVTPAAPAKPMPADIAPRAQVAAEPAYTGPLTGSFAYSGPPVIQNGEVVFEGLPPTALQLTYDVNAWDARVERSEGGRQRIVMRSKKPGTQKKCVVRWNATR